MFLHANYEFFSWGLCISSTFFALKNSLNTTSAYFWADRVYYFLILIGHCIYFVKKNIKEYEEMDSLPKPHEVEQLRSGAHASTPFTTSNGGPVWIFSPKLNGFRALWDMNKKHMFSRNRKSFAVLPEEFLAMLPSMKTTGFFLDGELVYDPRDLPVDDLLASQPSRVAAQANFEMLNTLVRAGSSSSAQKRDTRGPQRNRGSQSSRVSRGSRGSISSPKSSADNLQGTQQLRGSHNNNDKDIVQVVQEESPESEKSRSSNWKYVRYFVFDIFYHGDDESKRNMLLRDRIVMLKRIYDAMSTKTYSSQVNKQGNQDQDQDQNQNQNQNVFVLMPYYHYNPLCHSQYMVYAASKDHEGIVIRDTTSTYRDRARSMLKDRVFREATGTVSGVLYNKGGTYLIVEDDNKGQRRIKVRVANPLVTQVPSNGTVVTFRYHTMTPRGAYMNAVFNGASSKI